MQVKEKQQAQLLLSKKMGFKLNNFKLNKKNKPRSRYLKLNKFDEKVSMKKVLKFKKKYFFCYPQFMSSSASSIKSSFTQQNLFCLLRARSDLHACRLASAITIVTHFDAGRIILSFVCECERTISILVALAAAWYAACMQVGRSPLVVLCKQKSHQRFVFLICRFS